MVNEEPLSLVRTPSETIKTLIDFGSHSRGIVHKLNYSRAYFQTKWRYEEDRERERETEREKKKENIKKN